MSLEPLLRPWSGAAFRHLPAGSPFDVLDFRFAGLASDNRWNYQGEPTLYLASDRGVALAEYARHLSEDRSATTGSVTRRAIFRLEIAVDGLLDLRDSDACEALSIEGAPSCFLDKAVARATAHYVRHASRAQALLVPSMAFLDNPDRWVIVPFLEKLPLEVGGFVRSAAEAGTLALES